MKKANLTVFKATLYDSNNAIEAKDLKEHPLVEIVLEKYHQFISLFSNIFVAWIPPHRAGINDEVA